MRGIQKDQSESTIILFRILILSVMLLICIYFPLICLFIGLVAGPGDGFSRGMSSLFIGQKARPYVTLFGIFAYYACFFSKSISIGKAFLSIFFLLPAIVVIVGLYVFGI